MPIESHFLSLSCFNFPAVKHGFAFYYFAIFSSQFCVVEKRFIIKIQFQL